MKLELWFGIPGWDHISLDGTSDSYNVLSCWNEEGNIRSDFVMRFQKEEKQTWNVDPRNCSPLLRVESSAATCIGNTSYGRAYVALPICSWSWIVQPEFSFDVNSFNETDWKGTCLLLDDKKDPTPSEASKSNVKKSKMRRRFAIWDVNGV